MASKSIINVALVGNPNSGKTSVFNRFTGLNHKVGNFPGVTVDKKVGSISIGKHLKAKIIDLPGTYSLYPNSLDEKVVLDILMNKKGAFYPDVVVYVADASNLARHFLLLTQIMDLGIPVILAINMIDLALGEGIHCDENELQKILDIPMFTINGRTGEGIDKIIEHLPNLLPQDHPPVLDTKNQASQLIDALKNKLNFTNNYHALLVAHHHENLSELTQEEKKLVQQLNTKHGFNSIRNQVDETLQRFEKIQTLLAKTISIDANKKNSTTDKIDKVLTHKIYGSVIYVAILLFMFQAIFAWAEYPMGLIDQSVNALNHFLKGVLPNHFLTSLLTDGIITGLGGIIIFIPQITILFGLIAILEEVGYMSRAVMLSDNVMRKFGLNGRSIVSLISGVACAIPAIMSTRTIGNWKERLITIFVTPFISCSARIPVFTVLIAFAVPKTYYLGIFNLQGLVMMGLYVLGTLAALLSAYILKIILKSKETSYLMMEMPIYQVPYWKNVVITVFEKVKIFVFEAGKIIMIVSIILWALASYGPKEKMQQAVQSVIENNKETNINDQQLQDLIAAKKIEASYAGYFGKMIEPAIKPLGFDWKMGIALITSFAAREVFVSTMATIYSVGSSDDEKTIIEKMRHEKNPETGQPVYTMAVSLSLLIFYVFAMQCMSTLAVVKRETNSWLIPLYQLIYMTGLAYVGSLIVYNIFK